MKREFEFIDFLDIFCRGLRLLKRGYNYEGLLETTFEAGFKALSLAPDEQSIAMTQKGLSWLLKKAGGGA